MNQTPKMLDNYKQDNEFHWQEAAAEQGILLDAQ